jgi:hypothetical protein
LGNKSGKEILGWGVKRRSTMAYKCSTIDKETIINEKLPRKKIMTLQTY